jgi:hypothetical protein
VLPRDLVHLFRGRFLWDATWHERLRLWNYSRQPVRVSLTFDIDADFADIFEVRGMSRERRGTRCAPVIDGATLRLDYRGLEFGAQPKPPLFHGLQLLYDLRLLQQTTFQVVLFAFAVHIGGGEKLFKTPLFQAQGLPMDICGTHVGDLPVNRGEHIVKVVEHEIDAVPWTWALILGDLE